MIIGYFKSDTYSFDPDLIKKMELLGAERIVYDILKIVDTQEHKLNDTIHNMKEHDTLIIESLDDIGDNIQDVIEVLKFIYDKNMKIIILNVENYQDDIINNWELQKYILKQLINILIWVENKKDNEYRMKTSNAISYMKAHRGSGRPKKYSENAENPNDREKYRMVVKMLEEDLPIKRISEVVGIARNTIYTIKEELEEEEGNNN